jgi:acetolactate synthase regulatory subunit
LEHVRVLREMKRRGLRVVVVLADANTFGGRADTEHAAVELIASGVPTYVVKEGDELASALGR